MSSHIKPDSVDTYLSGICNRLEAEFPGVRKLRSSALVSRTLAGCRKRCGSAAKRKLPLSTADLRQVYCALADSTFHDDILFTALLVTGFKGLMRLGELVWPDSTHLQSYRKVILRRSFDFRGNGYSFELPTHKTSRVGHGELVVVNGTRALDNPTSIMRAYISSRDSKFPFSPELWLRTSGLVPTRSWFIKRLRTFFPPEISGHSMRAGGATSLALSGTAPAFIQAAGRWSSEEWQKYIRQHPFLQQALIHAPVVE